MSFKNRIKFSRASWAVSEQLISPIIMILLTPFLLRYLGVEQHGLWMLITAIVGMGQLTSLGVGVATIKYVSEDLACGKIVDAVLIVRASITIVLLFGALVFGVMLALSPFMAKTIFNKMGDTQVVSNLLVLGGGLIFIQELDNVYTCALRGAQRFDLSAIIELVTRFFWGLAVAILAWLYGTLSVVIYGVILLAIIKVLIKAYMVNRMWNVNDCCKPLFKKSTLMKVINFGKWSWLQSFAGVLFSVADRLLIGSVFGAVDLSRYTICMQITQYSHTLSASAMQVLFPWLSGRQVNKNRFERKYLFKLAIKLGALCALLSIILLIFLPYFIPLWLGASFYEDNKIILRVLTLTYGILAFSAPAHFLLMGLGKAKFISLSNFLAGIFTLIIGILLIPFGLVWFTVSKLLFGVIILVNFYKLKNPNNEYYQ